MGSGAPTATRERWPGWKGRDPVTAPRPEGRSTKNSEQLLAEALRARAGGTPGVAMRATATSRPVASRQRMTTVQVVLAAAIAGLVLGILAATLSLI
jgi:hypothetical protein